MIKTYGCQSNSFPFLFSWKARNSETKQVDDVERKTLVYEAKAREKILYTLHIDAITEELDVAFRTLQQKRYKTLNP